MGGTLREALVQNLTELGIRHSDESCNTGDSDDSAGKADPLYDDDWFRVSVGHRVFKIFRLGSSIGSIAVHDTHHLITGYGTDPEGEAALTTWELASGGCGRHWLMWLDRIVAIPTLVLFHPRASIRGYKRGLGAKNLYSEDLAALMPREFESVKYYVEGIAAVGAPGCSQAS